MSSKIKVDTIENVAGSGNVSLGSGHNLVVPGNNTTSGNATVGGTLGVTGDLTVDTSTLKVDSSNNRVGIGTASPGRKLELNNGGTGAFVTFTDGVATNFTFKTDGSNVGTFGTEAGSTHLAFMASGTERMRISSAGYITMPNQPAFNIRHYGASASQSSRTIGNTNSGGTVVEITDVGSHFDTSTGRFTAPVTGTYFFVASTTNGSASNSAVYIYKNGTNQLSQTGYHYGVAYNGTAVSAVAVLNANDYAHAIFQPLNSQTDTMYDAGFTGFLIG